MRRTVFYAASLAVAVLACEAPDAFAATGQAAINALIGNTITYKVADTEISTYFARDGWMKIMIAGKRDDSRWQAIDGTLCFQATPGTYGWPRWCREAVADGVNPVMTPGGQRPPT